MDVQDGTSDSADGKAHFLKEKSNTAPPSLARALTTCLSFLIWSGGNSPHVLSCRINDAREGTLNPSLWANARIGPCTRAHMPKYACAHHCPPPPTLDTSNQRCPRLCVLGLGTSDPSIKSGSPHLAPLHGYFHCHCGRWHHLGSPVYSSW